MKNFPKAHQKVWQVKTPAPVLSRILSRQLGISPITAQLLINRGIYTVDQARAFLGSELERLHHPLLLKDMDRAVKRLLEAVAAKEKVLVYGDYDADGMTATALLVSVFRRLGADVRYYIPNRLEEGYGIHLERLKEARVHGTSLVVSVDCGISALQEACWARENSLDLIITDHHEPSAEIPSAFAVINPKRPDCDYPFKDLAGVGVALKLAQALLEGAGEGGEVWQEFLDLVCLGTIADIVPIHGENRILVKHGLIKMAHTERTGLKALIEVCGINKDALGPREVGFGLVPRLNAAGRIGSPDLAANLLLTDNVAEAWEMACELNKGNQTRQRIEASVLEGALKLLEEKPELGHGKVLVLASEEWHPGVIGIVASRLTGRFYRPVFLIALEGEEGRGSARSIPEFNIHQALAHCQEHLLNFGGHAMAGGFSIAAGKIEAFRKAMNELAENALDDVAMVPLLYLDGIVDIEQISEELVHELDLLRPFGQDNPDPLLGCTEAPVMESRGVGKGAAHLKLRLRVGKSNLDGIGFNLGSYAEALATAESVDLAFVPGINEYNGRRSVQLEVKDLGLPASLDVLEQESREDPIPPAVIGCPAGEMTAGKEELFIPEQIQQILDRIKRAPGQSDHEACEARIQNVTLIDHRGYSNRLEKLAALTGDCESALVITACAFQTIELAHYLRLAGSGKGGNATCCHGLVSEDTRAGLTARFEAGGVHTLVATPAVAGEIRGKAQQVILYHLPYSPETIHRAVNALHPGGRLTLLYGPGDLEENLAALEMLAPNREYLACLYRILRREKKGSDSLQINLPQMARLLEEAGFPHSRQQSVWVALAVLEELGLLSKSEEGITTGITLFPAPSEKKELFESQTYRYVHRIKEETIAWMRRALHDPVTVLEH